MHAHVQVSFDPAYSDLDAAHVSVTVGDTIHRFAPGGPASTRELAAAFPSMPLLTVCPNLLFEYVAKPPLCVQLREWRRELIMQQRRVGRGAPQTQSLERGQTGGGQQYAGFRLRGGSWRRPVASGLGRCCALVPVSRLT